MSLIWQGKKATCNIVSTTLKINSVFQLPNVICMEQLIETEKYFPARKGVHLRKFCSAIVYHGNDFVGNCADKLHCVNSNIQQYTAIHRIQVKYRITGVVLDKNEGGKLGFVLEDAWFGSPLLDLLLLAYHSHEKDNETYSEVLKILSYSIL